jgi:hypothetical protein
MSSTGIESLKSFLFEQERILVNIKFHPGTGRDLTPAELAGAAAAALESAMSIPDSPPHSGLTRAFARDAFVSV